MTDFKIEIMILKEKICSGIRYLEQGRMRGANITRMDDLAEGSNDRQLFTWKQLVIQKLQCERFNISLKALSK